MDTKKRIELLESSLTRLLAWIDSANSTTNFLFTISTAMLGAVMLLAPPLSKWTIASAVVSAIAIVLLLSSLLMSSLVYFPRTKGPKGSLIFLGGIANMDREQYESAIKALTDEEYIADLISQCHRNAEIVTAKYTWLQRAMISLYLCAPPWVVAIYLLIQLRP
jgi:hypothetical protein